MHKASADAFGEKRLAMLSSPLEEMMCMIVLPFASRVAAFAPYAKRRAEVS